MTISKDTLFTRSLAYTLVLVGSLSAGAWLCTGILGFLLLPYPSYLVILDEAWASLYWGLALMGIGVSLIKIHDCLQKLSEIAEQQKKM